MPEEINRVLTDRLADRLLTPSRDADRNLLAEGITPDRIRFTGNVMVDTLLALLDRARALEVPRAFGLEPGRFAFVTLHRPSNVDSAATLAELIGALDDLGREMPVCFAVHPRTRQRMADFGLAPRHPAVRLLEPLGYLETVGLVERAALVLTDSGGLQEETTVLGVPCLTARPNTERPITVTQGTNQLVASTRLAARPWPGSWTGGPTAASVPAGPRAGMAAPESGSWLSWSTALPRSPGSLLELSRTRTPASGRVPFQPHSRASVPGSRAESPRPTSVRCGGAAGARSTEGSRSD
jgi:UDP-N-acetylglucosamine 2-epimerase (non-hydrolysing)